MRPAGTAWCRCDRRGAVVIRATSAGRPIASSVAGCRRPGSVAAEHERRDLTDVAELELGQLPDPDAATVRGPRSRRARSRRVCSPSPAARWVAHFLYREHVRVERGDRLGKGGDFRVLGLVGGRAAVQYPGPGSVFQVPGPDPHHHGTRLPHFDVPCRLPPQSAHTIRLIADNGHFTAAAGGVGPAPRLAFDRRCPHLRRPAKATPVSGNDGAVIREAGSPAHPGRSGQIVQATTRTARRKGPSTWSAAR